MDVSEEERVVAAVAEHLGADPAKIHANDALEEDLGLAPVNRVRIAVRLEELDGVLFPVERLETAWTVADMATLLRAARAERRSPRRQG